MFCLLIVGLLTEEAGPTLEAVRGAAGTEAIRAAQGASVDLLPEVSMNPLLHLGFDAQLEVLELLNHELLGQVKDLVKHGNLGAKGPKYHDLLQKLARL